MAHNKAIEDAGIDAVIKYEASAGRTVCVRVINCGYDLRTKRKDDTDERHIEVKSTDGSFVYERWLGRLQQEAFKSDKAFYLYLVTGVLSTSVIIHEYDRERLAARFFRSEKKHLYRFPRTDF